MKGTKWVVVRIGATGVKTVGEEEYSSYAIACTVQETLERQNPYTCFLIYTADEWMYEVENGRGLTPPAGQPFLKKIF